MAIRATRLSARWRNAMEFCSDQRRIKDCACSRLAPALLNAGREEGGEEDEEYSDCDSGVLPFDGSLGRGGRESRSCLG